MDILVVLAGMACIGSGLQFLRECKERSQQLLRLIKKQNKEILVALRIVILQFIAWLKYSLNGHGATTNSLLLNGWWLEFWEIVLLAAGDVESNPGPNQISDDQLAKVDNRVLGKGFTINYDYSYEKQVDILLQRWILINYRDRMMEKHVVIQLQQRKLRKLTLSDEILKQVAQEIFWSIEGGEINEDRHHMDEQMEKIVNILRKQIQIHLLALQTMKQRFLALLKHTLTCQSLTCQSGIFNNVLLDAWWLEFWEIVLLVAGDVESNPGPNQISDDQLAKVDNEVLGIKDLPCVLDSVIDCQEKWFNLCLALYVPYSKLSGIEMSHHDPTTCLREGLAVWLKGDYGKDQNGPPSWRMLVAAVDNSSGGNHTALALEIAKNHNMCEVGDAFKSSSPSPAVHNDPSSIQKGKEMSSAFSRLYRSLRRELRVDVEELKDVVRYSSNPQSLCECLVPPEAYEGATSTKDLLKRLFPTYINPQDTFLLEEIVENCGSRTCKRLLRDYTNKFF